MALLLIEKNIMTQLKNIPHDKLIYQFKIQILDTDPQVFRTIQVPANMTFHEFHEVIQKAFDWHDEHLYHFIFNLHNHTRFAIYIQNHDDIFDDKNTQSNQDEILILPDPSDKTGKKTIELKQPKTFTEFRQFPLEYFYAVDNIKSDTTYLMDFVEVGQVFEYCYDMGDSWEHRILREGLIVHQKGVRYPICIDGQGNHLFENIGGIGGYYYALEVLNDPKHEEYQDLIAWLSECCGRSFKNYDPNKFDINKVRLK